jgi:glutathionylspermidine synthase
MQRLPQNPRRDWARRLEDKGFDFHSVGPDGERHDDGQFHYWREDYAYRFTETEVQTLYEASGELHRMALDTVADVITRGNYAPFHLPPATIPWIERSWARNDLSVYGRFDLAWDGTGEPKLLEYNADTPTALVESAVAQWFWKEDVQPKADQFNSIHEALVARWRTFRAATPNVDRIYASAMPESMEDVCNTNYMLETAREAALAATYIAIPDIGADAQGNFFDLNEYPIHAMFKLYPWEWAMREAFAPQILQDHVRWIEPPWKMLLSNKALLPLLWQRFPNHPNLLPAFFEPKPLEGRAFVRKPLLSREGANVTLERPGEPLLAVDGPYGAEGSIWQGYTPLARFGNVHAVIGSWIVGDEAVGLGMREDVSPITRNTAWFVPHYFD